MDLDRCRRARSRLRHRIEIRNGNSDLQGLLSRSIGLGVSELRIFSGGD